MRKIRNIFLVIVVIGAVIGGLYLLGQVRSYTEYSVESRADHVDTPGTKYVAFEEYFVKYGNDGITCVDAGENKIWSQSFEMENPILAVCEGYLAVGDQKGRQIYIFSTNGYEGKVDTIYSILQLDISAGGLVATVLEKESTFYLSLYDQQGAELAKGTVHMDKSGYPLSLALSNDGLKMGVSFLNISDGDIKTTLCFYNFDSVGRSEIDNIVTSDQYQDQIFAKMVFLDSETCAAFGENQILIYSGTQKPALDTTIEVDQEVDGIFYGKDTVGVVIKHDSAAGVIASGDAENMLYEIRAYSSAGRTLFTKGFTIDYADICVLSNGEIGILAGNTCQIFTRYGLEKFSASFEDIIKALRARGEPLSYDIVFNEHTDSIRLG